MLRKWAVEKSADNIWVGLLTATEWCLALPHSVLVLAFQDAHAKGRNDARESRTTKLLTRQKIITCSRLLKTGCNNVVLPTLFVVVNNIVQHC